MCQLFKRVTVQKNIKNKNKVKNNLIRECNALCV